MDDEFLRGLWEPSDEDSFLDYWEPKRSKARKEVMRHLIEMMSSQRCPADNENTSNLYKLLVKKIREQTANFDSDPEAVDTATKKLAKWVESLVKETYYRKQGKIGQRRKEEEEEEVKEIRKSKLQLIDPAKDLHKDMPILKEMQQDIMEKEPSDMNVSIEQEVVEQNDEKAAVNDMKLKSPEIRCSEDTLPSVHGTLKLPSIKDLPVTKIDTKIKYKVVNDIDALARKQRLKDQIETIVMVKPTTDRVQYADPQIQVSKETLITNDTEVKIIHKCDERKSVCEEKPSVSVNGVDSSTVMIDSSRSGNPLVQNWSNWMLNLTKKAKTLVKWESTVNDELENDNESIREPTKSDITMQEKWNKLIAENEARKLNKYDENEGSSSKHNETEENK